MDEVDFFLQYVYSGECRNFIYVTLRNMYRMNQNYDYRYVDFFRRCLAYHLQASTEEVSQLKDSIMTAKEECQSLQVQVNAQKAHEVKLEMQLQTLQEDLKAPWCLLKRLRSPKWHDVKFYV